jgi:uncharacterized Tic20 family protein
MDWLSPVQMILIGFVLVLLGAVIPFLMTIGVIPAGFIISILSYVASVSGLFLGVLGAAMYMRGRKD